MRRIRAAWWGWGCAACCAVAAAWPGCNAALAQTGVAFTAQAGFVDEACENVDDDLQDVIEAMNDLGYGVTRGALETEHVAQRKQFLDPADDLFLAEFDATQAPGIRFGGQDAILLRICAPSANNYFGLTAYLTDTVLSDTGPPDHDPIHSPPSNASLGDSQNVLSLEGDEIFNKKVNVVVTADEHTADDIRSAFAALLPGELVQVVAIDPSKFLFSESDLDFPRTELGMTVRTSRIKGYALREGTESRPFYVFHQFAIDPIDPIVADLRDPSMPSPPTNLDQLQAHFDELVSSTVRNIERLYPLTLVSDTPLGAHKGTAAGVDASIFEHGFVCIDDALDCGLDNRDDLYMWDETEHYLTPGDLYVLVGLDYSRVAELGGPWALYNSFGVYQVNGPDGAKFAPLGVVKNYAYHHLERPVGVPPGRHVGLAEKLRRQGLLNNAFLLQVGDQASCLAELDDALCFDTVDPGEPVVFMAQATLNPHTLTHPDADQVIAWRLLHFTPAP